MNRKLLVLDLDETLIHASETVLDRPYDFECYHYFVYERPHLQEFLDYAFANFAVGVWSTATEGYASFIVSHAFSGHGSVEFLWTRSRCDWRFDSTGFGLNCIKDLVKLERRGYALAQMIAVDDSPQQHERNLPNLVQVQRYFGDQADSELARLCNYLDTLRPVEDVRRIDKRHWRDSV